MIEEAILKNTEALNRLAQAIECYTKTVSAITAPAPVAEAPAFAKLFAEAPAPAEAPKPRGRPKKEAEAPAAATPAPAPAIEAPKPAESPKPAVEAPKPTEAPKPAVEAPKPTEAPKAVQVISAADLKVFVKTEFHNKNNRDGYLAVCNEVFGGKISVDAMDEAQRAKLHAALKAALTASSTEI